MTSTMRIAKIDYRVKTERLSSCKEEQVVSETLSALVEYEPGFFVEVTMTPDEAEGIREIFLLKASVKIVNNKKIESPTIERNDPGI